MLCIAAGAGRILARTLMAAGLTLLAGAAPGARQALAQGGGLVVFAAASLKNALDDTGADFAKQTGKPPPRISYAGTPALARQIEQGAPADVFISADADWMTYLEGKRLIRAESRVDLLGNSIVVVAPASANIDLPVISAESLTRALRGGRLALADVNSVPGRAIRKGGARKAGRMGRAEGATRAERERARRARLRGARRGAAGRRLPHRRHRRTAREDRRRAAAGHPSANHLSCRRDERIKTSRRDRFPRLAARTAGARHVRDPRLSSAPEHGALKRMGSTWLSAEEWDAVRLSIQVASVAAAASLPLAIAIAFLLARVNFWGRSALDALVHLPLILPPVVTGYLLLLTFGRNAPVGSFLAEQFGIVFSFRWTGAALACAVMGFPLMVRAIRLSIEAVDRKLEEAAGALGASPAIVFLTVTLPLILPGLLAGVILSFAKAMGEFGATITFVSNIPGETQTLPSAIYAFTQVPGGDAGAIRLTIVSIVISVGALLASEALARRVARRMSA